MTLATLVSQHGGTFLYCLAALITGAGGAVTGYRAHRWLDSCGIPLPPDVGAWAGLVVALTLFAVGSVL